jgi:hypothetical protein
MAMSRTREIKSGTKAKGSRAKELKEHTMKEIEEFSRSKSQDHKNAQK